ncbi:MAG: alpha/beta hydrolase [Streptomycetaceae bacterium]|nr:alpha/beta hydrolase [Streptomycetaceae bacterium]
MRALALTNCEVHDNVPAEAFAPTVEAARAGLVADVAAAIMATPALARSAGLGDGYEHPENLSEEDILTFLTPAFGTPERARAFERLLVTSQTPDDLVAAEPGLRKLAVPTLLAWGTGDQFFDISWAHRLEDILPGPTTIVEVDGAKLFFPHERPGDLAPHLRRHWLTHG